MFLKISVGLLFLMFRQIYLKKGMNEEFLSYVWTFRLYTGMPVLADGQSLLVESPGTLNHDSGPDFLGARVRIGDTLWVGNVEVHMKSSDWKLHGHHADRNFDTVVLHVVFQHDMEILLTDGTSLPVFELQHHIDPLLYTRYLQCMASSRMIPCEHLLVSSSIPMQGQWLMSLGVQRMIRKGTTLNYLLQRLNGNWTEVLYVCFCRSFGNKINDDIFEMLALRTPLHLVRKYRSDRMALEALFFGQSGLLPEGSADDADPYIFSLREHFSAMLYQHRLEPMEPHHWKYLRTRPANFPNIRLAQLAALLPGFLDINPLSLTDIQEWMKKAVAEEVSEYWQIHYQFGKACPGLPHCIGADSVERLVINGLMPALIRYGDVYKNHDFITGLIEFMATLPPEDHSIIRKWKTLGVKVDSSVESQGVTELYNEYCKLKKCLDCRFGHHLLSAFSA